MKPMYLLDDFILERLETETERLNFQGAPFCEYYGYMA